MILMETPAERGESNVVVPLTGRLDVATSSELATRLAAIIDRGARILVLDLTTLDYISSAGLGVLISVGKKIRAVGGDMLFAGVTPHVKQILAISGFTQLFKIVATPDEAFRVG